MLKTHTVLVTDISYDADSDEDVVNLPSSLQFEQTLPANYSELEIMDELLGLASDYISDKTGYLHNSFVLESSCLEG